MAQINFLAPRRIHMPIVMNNVLGEIRLIAASSGDRAAKARRLAERIRKLGEYRWVGVYDVGPESVQILAFEGPGPPDHPSFPVSQGLTGAAIREHQTIVSNDVKADPRYLSAFGSTQSEIIVPVLDPGSGRVIGTVDVESEQPNAFGPRDREWIEHCARAALPLWLLG